MLRYQGVEVALSTLGKLVEVSPLELGSVPSVLSDIFGELDSTSSRVTPSGVTNVFWELGSVSSGVFRELDSAPSGFSDSWGLGVVVVSKHGILLGGSCPRSRDVKLYVCFRLSSKALVKFLVETLCLCWIMNSNRDLKIKNILY